MIFCMKCDKAVRKTKAYYFLTELLWPNGTFTVVHIFSLHYSMIQLLSFSRHINVYRV